jgi:hypothetical protein
VLTNLRHRAARQDRDGSDGAILDVDGATGIVGPEAEEPLRVRDRLGIDFGHAHRPLALAILSDDRRRDLHSHNERKPITSYSITTHLLSRKLGLVEAVEDETQTPMADTVQLDDEGALAMLLPELADVMAIEGVVALAVGVRIRVATRLARSLGLNDSVVASVHDADCTVSILNAR